MRTVWLEDCAQEEQRESEEEDAEAAIAEHEKDRSGLEGARRRRRKFGGASAVSLITVGASWPQAVPRPT